MSRNDRGDFLCPGCGRPFPECGCTPGDILLALERDRAEVSRRAAVVTRMSLDQGAELALLKDVYRELVAFTDGQRVSFISVNAAMRMYENRVIHVQPGDSTDE